MIKELERMDDEVYEAGYPPCYLPRRYIVGFMSLMVLAFAYNIRVGISTAIVEMSAEKGWGTDTQGAILAAFYAGYIFTQVPGGWLSARFGFKVVMTCGAILTSLICIAVPFVSFSVYMVIAARVISGITQGVLFPSNMNLISRWFPKYQRTLAASTTSAGGSFGTVLAMGISPLIIHLLGWQSVFYIGGGSMLLWILPWFIIFVHDRPNGKGSISCFDTHPNEIALIEKDSISVIIQSESLIIGVETPVKKDVPWRKLLLNGPVLAQSWTAFAGGWGWYVFLNWMPTYLQKNLGFGMDSSGIIAFLPYMLRPVVVIISGGTADAIANRGVLSRTNVRKVFNAFGCLLPASLVVIIALVDVSPLLAASLMILSIALAGLDGGVQGIAVDLGGEYASIIMGFTNIFGSLPGILGVYLTGYLLKITNNNWTLVFLLTAGVWASGAVFFSIFGSSEPLDLEERPRILTERTSLIYRG